MAEAWALDVAIPPEFDRGVTYACADPVDQPVSRFCPGLGMFDMRLTYAIPFGPSPISDSSAEGTT